MTKTAARNISSGEPIANKRYRRIATKFWSDDDLEIDVDAAVSVGDIGAWVQAWVWVSNDEAAIEKPK